MACIHVQLGQAGNQIGKAFWGLAEEEYLAESGSGCRSTSPSKPWRRRNADSLIRLGGSAMFHEDGSARCLAVDSEPKVVRGFREEVSSLRAENAISSQSGLANNWAMGFEACRVGSGVGQASGLFERCMEGLRKEAERSCWLDSVVVTHSLSGGTGSGFGSGVLQALRDEFPSLYVISACVGPFGAGDTPLQHYNSALALHHLQIFADTVIYRGNDDLLHQTQAASASAPEPSFPAAVGKGWRPVHSLSQSKGRAPSVRATAGKRIGLVSTGDMNASLSLDMASLFFPTSRTVGYDETPLERTVGKPAMRSRSRATSGRDRHGRRGGHDKALARPFDGGSLVAAACPVAAAKFVDLRSTLSAGHGSSLSFASANAGREWASLGAHLARTAPLCPRRGGGQSNDVCIAAYHVVRGGQTHSDACAAGREYIIASRVPPVRRNDGWKGVERHVTESDATGEYDSARAADALRMHHECPVWCTGTRVSRLPALQSQGVSHSMTAVCNQTRIRDMFASVLAAAETKFKAGAYLHWYYRHGLEDEDFVAAFEGVRAMEQTYSSFARSL